jgi:hypothetical protein
VSTTVTRWAAYLCPQFYDCRRQVYFQSVGVVSTLSLYPLLSPVGQGPTYSELLTLGKACEFSVECGEFELLMLWALFYPVLGHSPDCRCLLMEQGLVALKTRISIWYIRSLRTQETWCRQTVAQLYIQSGSAATMRRRALPRRGRGYAAFLGPS